MCAVTGIAAQATGRTPQGVRGLKCFSAVDQAPILWVAPRKGCVDGNSQRLQRVYRNAGRTPQGVRGLKFILIIRSRCIGIRRTPQGVRGLKFAGPHKQAKFSRRTPQGGRGLKCPGRCTGFRYAARSHPARGAWIEISFLPAYCRAGAEARRTPQGVRGLK